MSVEIIPLLVFATAQIGTPGPANLVLMATGARYGLRRALPFVAGVALGKQIVIWPLGFGLMELAGQAPALFLALKWAAVAYICWLAWRVANLRLRSLEAGDTPPGFLAGLLIHPVNPKAWAMILTAFATFVSPGTSALHATLIVAICLLGIQVVLHPLWTWGGDRLAGVVAGRPAEKYLMLTLAALTVASVVHALVLGGTG